MRFKNIISDILVSNRFLLEENDKRTTIVNVIGFSQKWADLFHTANPKFALWVANSFLDHLFKKLKNDSRKKIFNTSIPPDIEGDAKTKKWLVGVINESGEAYRLWESTYRTSYAYIFDWYRNINVGGNRNIKTYSYEEALNASQEWHDSRDSIKEKNYVEKNEVVIDYRDSNGVGYYWTNLNKEYSKEEADRMGHCGNKSGHVLFSLRSINEKGEGESFVTLARTNDGTVSEVHGKKNSKPKSVYHTYIIDFLLNQKYPVKKLTLKNVYKPDHNFQLNDLDDSKIEKIFSINKDIKFNYIFGDDVTIVGKEFKNKNIALVKKDKLYGLADINEINLIKPIKYKLLSGSDLTEFVEKNDKFYVVKHYSNNDDDFYTVNEWDPNSDAGPLATSSNASETLFKLIDKEEAKKLIEQ